MADTTPESDDVVEIPQADVLAEARLTPAEAIAPMQLRVPARGNRKLRRVLENVNADAQIKAWWHVSNVNAVLGSRSTTTPWVHVQIVANIALRLLRLLVKHGVEPSLQSDYRMSADDSEVVVVLAAFLHDVGMSIHRRDHEDWSLFLAEPKMRQLLEGVYEEPELTVVVSEALQAITSHRADGEPLRSRPACCASPMPSTWRRVARASPSSAARCRSTRSPRRPSTRYGSPTATHDR